MSVQREVGDIAVGHSTASSVVTDELALRCQELGPVAPFRYLPLQSHMAERQHEHKRLALSQRPKGDVHAVACLRILNAGFHGGTHSTSGGWSGCPLSVRGLPRYHRACW